MKKSLWSYCTLVGAFYLASNFIHPVTPTLIVERGLDSSLFGVAFAAMMVMNFLFSPFWGKLSSHIPTRRVLAICIAGYIVGQAIFGFAQSEAAVIGGRMFAGIFGGGVFVAFSNYGINIAANERERSRNLTAFITVQNVVGCIGYFVGGMLGLISVNITFIVQVAMLAVVTVLCGFLLVDDTPYKHVSSEKLHLSDANPFKSFLAARHFMTPMLALLFIIAAIGGIGQNSFDQCFNFYIKDQFGLSSAYNGIFKAMIAVVSLIANSTLCLWLQHRTETNITMAPVMAGCAVLLGGMLFFDTVVPFVIVDVLFFALNAIRMPILQNLVSARADAEHSNSAMGFYNAMTAFGGIFGALFAGLIYSAGKMLPFILAFVAFAAAAALSYVYAARFKRERANKAE